jgi:hypothetical protein
MQVGTTRVQATRPEVVDAVTTDVAEAEAAWDTDALFLRPTWPILAMGWDTKNPYLEASPGKFFLVMCLSRSRNINMGECHTQTFIKATATEMFVSPAGLMRKTATHPLHARFSKLINRRDTRKLMPSSSLQPGITRALKACIRLSCQLIGTSDGVGQRS